MHAINRKSNEFSISTQPFWTVFQSLHQNLFLWYYHYHPCIPSYHVIVIERRADKFLTRKQSRSVSSVKENWQNLGTAISMILSAIKQIKAVRNKFSVGGSNKCCEADKGTSEMRKDGISAGKYFKTTPFRSLENARLHSFRKEVLVNAYPRDMVQIVLESHVSQKVCKSIFFGITNHCSSYWNSFKSQSKWLIASPFSWSIQLTDPNLEKSKDSFHIWIVLATHRQLSYISLFANLSTKNIHLSWKWS